MEMEITEDLIAQITGLSLEGTKFFNKKVDREVETKKFLEEGENLEFVVVGIKVASIPKPFAELAKMVV
ncbi:hypothetical protein KI387_019909, partial [Taxus chinensis]